MIPESDVRWVMMRLQVCVHHVVLIDVRYCLHTVETNCPCWKNSNIWACFIFPNTMWNVIIRDTLFWWSGHWTRSSLKIMACCLFSTKPLPSSNADLILIGPIGPKFHCLVELTYWGQVMHLNVLSLVWCQAITWPNGGLIPNGTTWEKFFSEIWINTQK